MKRATLLQFQHDMQPFRVPKHTYSACTLAQTLEFLGLYKDAFRVDMTISENHFVRPMYGVELAALWNGLDTDNRYLRAAIRAVKGQMQAYRNGDIQFGRACRTVMILLEDHPELEAALSNNEDAGHNSSPSDPSLRSLSVNDVSLQGGEQSAPQGQSDAATIAKRRGKAKILRIVVDGKKSGEPSQGQDLAVTAASDDNPAK